MVPKKQRHTARRIFQRLVEEHDAEVSESTVAPLRGDREEETGTVASRCVRPPDPSAR